MEMEKKFDIQDPKSPWMPKKGEKVTFCFDWVDRNFPAHKVNAGAIGTVQSEMPYLVKVGEMTVTVSPAQIRPVREASKKEADAGHRPSECNVCERRLDKDDMGAGESTCWKCRHRLQNFDQSAKEMSELSKIEIPNRNPSIEERIGAPKVSSKNIKADPDMTKYSEPQSKCTCPPGHSCPASCPPDCSCERKACMATTFAIKFPSVELKQQAIETLRKAGFKSVAFTPSDIQEQSPIDQKEVKFAPDNVQETPETWNRYLQLKKKYENMNPTSSQTFSGDEYVEYRRLKNYYDQQSTKSTYTDEQFRAEAEDYVKTASKKKEFKVGDVVVNTVAWKNLPKNTFGRVEASTEHYLEIKFANSDTPFAFSGDYLDSLQKSERIAIYGNEKEIHAKLVEEVDQAKTFWKEAKILDIKNIASEFKNEFEQFCGKKVDANSKWDYIEFMSPRIEKKIEHYASKLNNYKQDDGAIYKIALEDLVYENSAGQVKKAVDEDRINKFERERQVQRLLSRVRHIGMPFKGNDVVFAPNDQPTGTNPNHPMSSPRDPEHWVDKAFLYLRDRQYPDATAAYKGIIGCDEAKHMSAQQKEELKRLMIAYGLAVEC